MEQVLALVDRFLRTQQTRADAAGSDRPTGYVLDRRAVRHERIALNSPLPSAQVRAPSSRSVDGEHARPRTGRRARQRATGDAARGRIEPRSGRLRGWSCRLGQDGRARGARRCLPSRRLLALGAAPSGVAAATLAAETEFRAGTLHRCSPRHGSRAASRAAACFSSTRPGWPTPAPSAIVLVPGRARRGEGGPVGDPGHFPPSARAGCSPRSRTQRRDRAPRQPPPARRARTPRARAPAEGAAATTLPTQPSRGRLYRRDRSRGGEGAARRRLVAGRLRRPGRQRDDRLPARRRRRAQRRRPHPPRPRRTARPRAAPPRLRDRARGRRPRPLHPQRPPPRDRQRQPRHRHRRRPRRSGRSRFELDDHRRLTLPARATSTPATSRTPTRSPATRPRGSRSSARSCSPTTDARSGSGATSPSPAPASRPASTRPRTSSSPTRRPTAPSPTVPVDRLAEALTRARGRDARPRRRHDADPTRPSAPRSPARPANSESNDWHSRRNAWTRPDSCTRRTATLAGLGVLGRARHGRALRDEIDAHEQTTRASRPGARPARPRAPRDARARVRARPRSAAARARPQPRADLGRGLGASGASTAGSSCESHVDADVALEPERPLHPDLDLHDPPQLPRPLDLQLPQPLRLTAGLAPQLVRERSRHPRQIRDRGHPRPQPRRRCAPRVAPRRRSSNPRRVPAGSATTFSSPIGVRSRSTGSSEATPRRPSGAAGRRASPPARRAPPPAAPRSRSRNEGQTSTPLVTSSVPRITRASPPIST